MDALKGETSVSNELQDSQIVSRVLAGEKALFEILLRRHNQTLYRVLRGYLKDQDEVQDAMQNAYLKAFHKLSQFQGHASFSTWLIRIGINEALMRLKEMNKGKIVYLNSFEMEHARQIPDKNMNPEKVFISQETKQLFERAIDNLPEKYRIIYILKEIEGLENEQIEASLNISESNIKVRLHRAKKLLKDNLFKLSSRHDVFEFGNSRCDAVVSFVMARI